MESTISARGERDILQALSAHADGLRRRACNSFAVALVLIPTAIGSFLWLYAGALDPLPGMAGE